MKRKNIPSTAPFLLGVLACLLLLTLFSAPCVGAERVLHIDIFGPGQSKLNVYLAEPLTLGSAPDWRQPLFAQDLGRLIRNNLEYVPYILQVPGKDILGGPQPRGATADDIDFKRFNLSQVDLLLTAGWKPKAGAAAQVEVRAYDVYQQRLILGRGYVIKDQEQLPRVADRFCASLLETLTGRGELFRSEFAFVRKEGENKEIWTVTAQGRDLRQITRLGGLSLSPSWSSDGRYLVFTYVNNDRHQLGIWDIEEGRVNTALLPGNTLISPTFTPDGRIVVSLDPRGNPDIYLLNEDHQIDRTLVENWAIDISPQFDRLGRKMAFVSSRLGNPHVFVLDMQTGGVQRVSFRGTYNTSPDITPDGRLVAFSRLTPEGHRIFVSDLETGLERQVSFGPGNDEDPSWAPDGYFLAFSSDRSGEYKIYLTTRHGDEAKMVPTGPGVAKSPVWGPVQW